MTMECIGMAIRCSALQGEHRGHPAPTLNGHNLSYSPPDNDHVSSTILSDAS